MARTFAGSKRESGIVGKQNPAVLNTVGMYAVSAQINDIQMLSVRAELRRMYVGGSLSDSIGTAFGELD